MKHQCCACHKSLGEDEVEPRDKTSHDTCVACIRKLYPGLFTEDELDDLEEEERRTLRTQH